MEIYSKTERGEERHHTTCDHCGKTVYPSHKNRYVFWGFLCKDTGMFISNDCKEQYYADKNAGKYGEQHAHKYSEVPVNVPWTVVPKYKPLELVSIPIDNTQSLQYKLF